jgi:diguanylate cyclase (GGDEF)-like protein
VRSPTILRISNVVAAVIIGSVIAAAILFLLYDRKTSWESAAASSKNLVRVLDADISRTIRAYDLSLQGVIEGLALPELAGLRPGVVHRLLFDRAATADYLGTMVVLDVEGNITYDSRSDIPAKLNLADRDYFQAHRAASDVGLYISKPYYSRLRNGDEIVVISRRLSHPDGSFAGVVLGALRLAYFTERFRTVSLGRRDSITVLRDDGTVIVRDPDTDEITKIEQTLLESDTGKVSQRLPRQQYLDQPSGTFTATSAVDGVERYFTFAHVAGLPLVINVALSVDDIMRPWSQRAWFIGLSTFSFCGAVILLVILFRRVVKHGTAQATQLTELARTDGLTGLLNRRAFDAAIEHAWADAIPSRRPLSLLFIDADYFKRFNDLYGHPAGDELLKKLANVVKNVARRPSDLAARYGGEEFVVLLQDTVTHSAVRIANEIRQAVEQLQIRNGETWATVSVGVASLIPTRNMASDLLVEEADLALYTAKSKGRNRVDASRGDR